MSQGFQALSERFAATNRQELREGFLGRALAVEKLLSCHSSHLADSLPSDSIAAARCALPRSAWLAVL